MSIGTIILIILVLILLGGVGGIGGSPFYGTGYYGGGGLGLCDCNLADPRAYGTLVAPAESGLPSATPFASDCLSAISYDNALHFAARREDL